MRFYDGAREKVCRLALADLFLELEETVLGTRIALREEAEANGAAGIREALDDGFRSAGGWEQRRTGKTDWLKRFRFNQTLVARIGVEIQVSARSDLLIRDVVHLRNSLQAGEIDAGVIVVPSDRIQADVPAIRPVVVRLRCFPLTTSGDYVVWLSCPH